MSQQQKPGSNGFSPTTMIALVLVSVTCLLGMALLSAFEPELKSGNDGASHALSKSSVGYSGMVQLMANTGEPTILSRKELSEEQSRATLVMTPTSSTSDEQIDDVRHYGPLVLLMPKWTTEPKKERRGWSLLAGRVSEKGLIRLLPERWLDDEDTTTFSEAENAQSISLVYKSFAKNQMAEFGQTASIKNLRTISGKNWISVVAGPNGGALIAKHNKENVYLIADPDLFNNAGLSNVANARLLAHFMADIREGDPIVFDLTLNGFQRQPNLGRVAIEPPVLGATLCLALAGLLIGLQAAVRFLPPAPARRVMALGKRALADNTAGLIRMGKREHRMALPYANLIKRQVAKAISLPPNIDPVALTTSLDRVSEQSKSDLRISSLTAQAGAAATPQDLIKVAKDLQRWKQETIRERQ